MKKSILIVCLGFISLDMLAQGSDSPLSLSLAGEWNVTLGDAKEVKHAMLPGTIDTNHLGFAPSDTTETTHLTRLYAYKGKATYSRTIEIPKQWKKAAVELFLERTKPTWVYVDGNLVDSCNFISTPQRYILPKLKTGKHQLDIVVDNSRGVPEQVYGSSHAYTEDTQTNWNGIIGEISLKQVELKAGQKLKSGMVQSESRQYTGKVLPCFRDFRIEGAHFYADGHPVFLRGKHDAAVWPLTGHVDMTVEGWMKYLGICSAYGINHVRFHSWCPPEAAFVAADSLGIYLQPELPFWGSFDDKDETLMTFLHQEGENILREYGHHPSFRMMALGNELWGSIDKMKEFVDDFREIAPHKYYTFGSNYYLGYQGVKEGMDYFTTCRIGGEGWGKYNTHTRGSFSFADAYDGGIINHFRPNTTMNFDEACDKWASPQPWQRQDVEQTSYKRAAGIPIISHETGQFQTYPDFREIKKYTGVLYPYNFEIFRRRLAAAGMLSQADDFHKASGLWSVKLYKADIEMDLRTKNMAGFQLLDIQDYPGQGSAFVGILDAFMESKGITTANEWHQWCSSVVPLLVTDRFCYDENEMMNAKVQIANYGGESLKGKKLLWKLDYASDENSADDASPKAGANIDRFNQPSPLAQGEIPITTDEEGLIDIGEIHHKMKVMANGFNDGNGTCLDVKIPSRKVILTLDIDYGRYDARRHRNTYDLWIYTTEKSLDIYKEGVVITSDLTDEVAKKLEKGAKVLWMPTTSKNFVASVDTISQAGNATPYTVGGLFQTDYWNYRMFKTICENNKKTVSPGTLGILTNPKHPIFCDFPTEMHTNWQWFPVIKESHPLVLDNFAKDDKPIVQVIDNIERNHKLGLVMEWKVGAGKLLVCMSDLEKASEYPEGRAFYESVLSYMRSPEFAPQSEITIADLRKKLKEEPRQISLKELNNISQY
ncbi:putative beta-galactosidase [Prevotella sp. CAG:732]|nr:beta-galactosidase [Prevotella sp. CAG:732]CDD18581.1 putative beta-galactosidase [Prevotella sp. CAG:732]